MNARVSTLEAPRDACASCEVWRAANLKKLGVRVEGCDFVVALAGNPNTGKSTVFNALTGLRQHTGNWPGKTVTRAEGAFEFAGRRFKLVDLPGTYSLLSTSLDEEIARDFILFGQPHVTVVVVDATRLERNLNLVLQVLEITDRVVVCLNLMDEARRHGLQVDERQLARDLGVPVVPCAARQGEGLPHLLEALHDVASGKIVCRPRRIEQVPPALQPALSSIQEKLRAAYPELPNARWVALRLLAGDEHLAAALRRGDLGRLEAVSAAASVLAQTAPAEAEARFHQRPAAAPTGDRPAADPAPIAAPILREAEQWRRDLQGDLHEHWVQAIYAEAARLTARAVSRPGQPAQPTLDRAIDRIVTSRVWGFPVMLALFALMFWITISGANVPSGLLAELLVDRLYPWLREGATALGFPWWLRGVTVDGMYLATAWVVSVMLPPMAIFFPLFTLLEDFGYLPRVAFNLDALFKRAGAHGKQSMTTMMGFGCNAAGVVATRIIDSPRERLIAILTNNFALCNGRWPTQFLIAALFVGALVPAHWAGVVSAAAVTGVAALGVLMTLAVSWALSRTLLRGEVSTFSLELPPYRPPRILRTLYTSLIDRTIFVLWRAVVFALPAGAVIWLSANVHVGGASVAEHLIRGLDPVGTLVGLNGVILLAYIVAIPANEIIIPTILMLTVLVTGAQGVGQGAGVMFELESPAAIKDLLLAGGWTTLTGVNLMLFSLLHNPCSTTLYTIYKETGSGKWTALAALIPLALGFAITGLVALLWRLLS
ncbi:MAG: ferrous iron transport protein B [Verrucomicrobiae bacterium]|nr:ferrous iron transport protein B [Verrucomicrobiae bacterium]